MARTLGPVLAMGAITMANAVVLNAQPIANEIRIPVGTAIAAAGFALLERLWADGAVALAWLGLISVMFVRMAPNQPTPVENLSKWYNRAQGAIK